MTQQKLEVEKFNGENDFNLWRLKMKAILVHQGLEAAIEEDPKEAVVGTSDANKLKDILKQAHSVVILSFGDSVLMEVSHEKRAAGQ